MVDFCLGPPAIIGITRRVHLMDRMCESAGIPTHRAEPGLWYEARLRCIGCAASRQCAQFLASVRCPGQRDVPGFCANRVFFTEQIRSPAPGRVQ
jgi:uncharacterized protein DUF6455